MAFMTHPIHGATHTNDIAAHEKNGWKVTPESVWLASKIKPENKEPPRRGRPRKEPK